MLDQVSGQLEADTQAQAADLAREQFEAEYGERRVLDVQLAAAPVRNLD